MPELITKKLTELQSTPEKVRNICILAHVDHGKTTLADSLVASNGLISSRLAGKLRYMDSRPDEQQRGITMKSSAVSLYFQTKSVSQNILEEYLINLIDSPGHVDFSSEVSTAVRLCDGAIVVIDVIEGVQPQTKVVLQQAWSEGIKPILVLNKIDRCIVEMKESPLDAYIRLTQVLEAANAIIGELFASTVMEENTRKTNNKEMDWTSGLEDADDSDLYFSPDAGNVVFGSAYDGWGFGLSTFVNIYSKKLGFSSKVLSKTLWGDYYLQTSTKKIQKGAIAKAKKPLFVSLILENIWAIYEHALKKDKEKLEKIISALNLKISPRDFRSNDPRTLISAIFSQWLPLSEVLLKTVVEKLPAPNALTEERVEHLMCSKTKQFSALPSKTKELKSKFIQCSSDDSEPTIVFVSKMFPISKKSLPKNKPQSLTPEEMARRKDAARAAHAERLAMKESNNDGSIKLTEDQLQSLNIESKEKSENNDNDTVFLAFARVYSGCLKPDSDIYVLGPKHDPGSIIPNEPVYDPSVDLSTGGAPIMKGKIGSLFLLLGREVEDLSCAPAGSIVGIGGLETKILKSATLSTDVYCPPFVEVSSSTVPIMRVAIEPTVSTELAALEKGLKLLNQADAHVQVSITDKGEHILVTAGEVHLERCILDLKESYARIDVNVSEPLVPFRETIITPPKIDMVNVEIIEDETNESSFVVVETPDKRCKIEFKAVPLPESIVKLLETNYDVLKDSGSDLSTESIRKVKEIKLELHQFFEESSVLDGSWTDKIWSFGPRKSGTNLLINPEATYSVWTKKLDRNPGEYDSSFIQGFQLATSAGPLCEEPLRGVIFIVKEWSIIEETEVGYGPLSGQIISIVKEGCRQAFQAQPQRLMVAMYSCDISVKAEVLGKMYAVLGKRHGKIVQESMIEGSSTFIVTANLPVVESMNFANEIRKQTSGLAMPQLVFSHWEVIDVDPFWVPVTEEEILHFGEKADSDNLARHYMNEVRRRKGLSVDEKIVEFAEKQRTVSKKK